MHAGIDADSVDDGAARADADVQHAFGNTDLVGELNNHQ